MQKNVLLLLLVLLGFGPATAQLNSTLVSRLDYVPILNDIWGYVAPDGTEYALVGLTDGVSIVSLANPSQPREVAKIPGQQSIWRDLKTFGEYAYVVADQSGTTEGLTIIDLSQLPESAAAIHYTPILPGGGQLQRCHNLYVDEDGLVYLAGCNVNDGGVVIFDAAQNATAPPLVKAARNIYAHDVYAQDNRMYASEIYRGRMAIYDITDKNNITLLGSETTPAAFTHNVWVNAEGTVAFTTDEKSNAPIGAYDVSDPANIIELDQFRPLATLGQGVIPHNVHVIDNYLVISHYTDGGVIVDASRPNNLVEVANYDTYPFSQVGFEGAWGAYPFLPSGLVLLTDRSEGLHVVRVDYRRAAWLEGRVTDKTTGQPLTGVQVEIDAEQLNATASGLNGRYGTGLAAGGSYEVTFLLDGYLPVTVETTLENGVVRELDVELTPAVTYRVSGQAVVQGSGAAIPGAAVLLRNTTQPSAEYELTADAEGRFNLDNVQQGTYDIYYGAWGYLNDVREGVALQANADLRLELAPGYKDDFILDLGWTTEADTGVTTGHWERAVPVSTNLNGVLAAPTADAPGDLGDMAYVTDNSGGGAADSDIDGGRVRLISPVMDLSNLENVVLSYRLWYVATGGNTAPDDELTVRLTNGENTILLQRVTASLSVPWRQEAFFTVDTMIELTSQMQLIVETGDTGQGHLIEAGVDAFSVLGSVVTDSREPVVDIDLRVFPNPSSGPFVVKYDMEKLPEHTSLRLYNALGQLVEEQTLTTASGQTEVGRALRPGVYYLQIVAGGKTQKMHKLVKQ